MDLSFLISSVVSPSRVCLVPPCKCVLCKNVVFLLYLLKLQDEFMISAEYSKMYFDTKQSFRQLCSFALTDCVVHKSSCKVSFLTYLKQGQ